MVQYLGLEAVGWQTMTKNWWQLVRLITYALSDASNAS